VDWDSNHARQKDVVKKEGMVVLAPSKALLVLWRGLGLAQERQGTLERADNF
jgi:hypothetical protein